MAGEYGGPLRDMSGDKEMSEVEKLKAKRRAENAAKRLGLAKPPWLSQSVYESILFDHADAKAEPAADGRMYVSDLAMNEAAAAAAAR